MVLAQVNDAITTKSELNYRFKAKAKAKAKGEGNKIDSGTVVIRHNTVGLSNGENLYSSRDASEPFVFEHPSDRLIKGTNEILSLRSLGERVIFIMPYYFVYGEKGDSEVLPEKH